MLMGFEIGSVEGAIAVDPDGDVGEGDGGEEGPPEEGLVGHFRLDGGADAALLIGGRHGVKGKGSLWWM